MKPTVAVTMWRRRAPTFLYEDTFMHTLVEDYVRALDRAGAVMLMIGRLDAGDVDQVLAGVDGLVITGGGDFDPARYGAENTHSVGIEPEADQRDLALVRGAQARRMPVLGICRGLQAVNIALGGSLHQEINGSSDDHPKLADSPDERNAHRHVVRFEPGSRLADLYGAAERAVNSLHHQGVAPRSAQPAGRRTNSAHRVCQPRPRGWMAGASSTSANPSPSAAPRSRALMPYGGPPAARSRP